MATAPRGYKNITTEEGKRIIVPNEDAEIMRWAFTQLATGQYNIDEIRRCCNEKGMKCGKDNFWQIIKNPVYCGKIQIPAWKDEEFTIVKGLHEPIISEALFERVQDVLAGKKRLAYSAVSKDEFPLRGFLLCPRCGKNLTGSGSTGGSGIKHYYYHCIKGCTVRHKAFDLNDDFSDKLAKVVFDTDIVNMYDLIIADVFKSKNEGKSLAKQQIQIEVQKHRDRINNAQQMMLDGLISPDEYRDIKKRYEPIMDALVKTHLSGGDMDAEFKRYLKRGLCVVKNLEAVYNAGQVKDRQSVLRSILKENLRIENNEVRTGKLNDTFSLIARVDGAYRAEKKRTVATILPLSAREVPSGFEPLYELLQSSA